MLGDPCRDKWHAYIRVPTIIPGKVKQSYNVIHDGDYSDNAYIAL